MKNVIKSLFRRLGRTGLGRTFVMTAAVGDPRSLRFSSSRWWPERLDGFEDLVFLFSSNQLNHGIISQELDEAGLLYRVARDIEDGAVVEIGRFKGGSTFLLATALAGRAELWSYDIHVEHDAPYTGAELDDELAAALRRYGLQEHVHLIVGDSRSVAPPPGPIGACFIDGDHSYDGVRADWDHWGAQIAAGGHVLFHDAVDHGGIGTYVKGVGKLVAELDQDSSLARQLNAGGIAHFIKIR